MSHAVLAIKFDPEGSAYWLPKSGRLAASRLQTVWFWGLRICFTDDPDDQKWPPWLFIISSYPSPYPVEHASYTIGPKVVHETEAIVDTDAEILTTIPIPTMEEWVWCPLYLHAIPALPINVYRCPSLRQTSLTLTEDSLRTFQAAAVRCYLSAMEKTREALATHDPETIKNGWFAPRDPSENDGRMFGEPSDPHKYVFDFNYKVPPGGGLPLFEGPSDVYDEVMLYNQLCKDYKWLGVDYTIDRVQEMREAVGRGLVVQPSGLATVLPNEPRLHGALRQRAIELAALGNPHVRIASVLEDRFRKRLESAAKAGHDSTDGTDSSDVEFLPWEFPRLPFRYPVVPLGPTKVVVFDICGTIMDREQAIQAALSTWFAQYPLKQSTTLCLVVDRFITLEALAERDAQKAGSPTSLATFARSALMSLVRELRLDMDERSPFFTETLKRILSPAPYPEVEQAITALKQRGYTLVCLPTHSATTMQQLRSSFPPAFADGDTVRPWTEHISVHFLARAWLFSSLRSFCESLVKETLQPSEILVVSSSVGRVLHAALNVGHATAWVRRPGNLEGNVDFVVGDDENSCPVPSLVVSGLMELVAKL